MAGEFELLDGRVRLIQASALSIPLPDASVDCCVTSPPYWGLRNYLNDPDQIGQEKTLQEYVAKMVQVFREVWRVLKPSGTLWLNLGDSYNAAGRVGHGSRTGCKQETNRASANGLDQSRTSANDLKPKDLVGVPWRVAFALQEAGWYLRSDIIWAKPNPMPESVRDRPTRSHEYIFLLSKNPRYYYNADAIKEKSSTGDMRRPYTSEGAWQMDGRPLGQRHGGELRSARDNFKRSGSKREQAIPGQSLGTHRPQREDSTYDLTTRNKRDVWFVATHSFKGAHFATFPPKLIEPCILAGCPENGLVLDPFGGSGTTGKVAADNNRRAVLLDINYKDEPGSYLEIAWDRILAPTKPRPKHRAEEPGLVTGSLFSGEASVQ